jgi:DNA-binding CsgD family transcriptional regulator
VFEDRDVVLRRGCRRETGSPPAGDQTGLLDGRGDRQARRPEREPDGPHQQHGDVHRERAPAPPDGLTQREAEILGLIALGLTNPEIAQRLFLSSHTVKTHINRIFAKTGSRDRAAAIGYAHRHHLD